jgi:hypothetical protein
MSTTQRLPQPCARRGVWAWVRLGLLLACLAQALMPSLAHVRAWASPSGSGWTEVCTAQGTRWLKLDALGRVLAQSSQRPDDAPAASMGADCGYCLLQAQDGGPLPSHGAAHPPALHATHHSASTPPPRPAHSLAWWRPAPRGPPAITPVH